MSGNHRKEIVRHLSEEDLDRLLAKADDPKVICRLAFVKNLYKEIRLRRVPTVCKAKSTGSR